MDEFYEMFLSELGPQFTKVQPSPQQIDRFSGRLPEQLLEYWKLYGWCGYYEGLFWLVNPDDYVSVVETWLESTQIENKSDYLAIARTAFGRIFLWNKEAGQTVTIVSLDSQIILPHLIKRWWLATTPSHYSPSLLEKSQIVSI